jgi:hypothetical protein
MAKGSPQTEPVKEEKRVTRDLTGLNVINLKGAGIYYQRMVAAAPAASVYIQAIPPNAYTDLHISAVTSFKVSNARDALLVGGSYALYVLKNGVEATTGYTMSRDFFHVTAAPATTDVWEVFYAFDDTVDASSNSSSSRSSSSSSRSSSSSSKSSSSSSSSSAAA